MLGRTHRLQLMAAGFALPVAAALIYGGQLAGPFLFDDQAAIVDNASLRDLLASLSPPRETPVAARPLVNLSFAIDRALFGLSPAAFHRTNLLFHLACAVMLLVTLRRLLRCPRVPAAIQQHADLCASLTALAFCVHPLGSEIVLYATQRSEASAALCYLGTIYLLACEAEIPKRIHLFATLLIALLGAMSKEVVVTAPLVALCFDRAFIAGSFAAALRARWRFYAAAACVLVPIALLQLSRPRPDSIRFAEFAYLLAQSEYVPHYFALAFWPARLALDYGPLWPDAPAPAWPLPLLAAAVSIIAALLAWRHPRLGFIAIWIAFILAPSSSLFSIHTEIAAERRFYLPLAGILAYLVAGAIALARDRFRQGFAATFGAIALIALAARSHARGDDYRSVRRAWQSAVWARPQNARAHYNLAETYRREGANRAAIAELLVALQVHESYADAHSNLAGLLLAQGDVARALPHAARAAELAPHDALAHLNYGIALGLSSEPQRAVNELRSALRLRPDLLEIRSQLATALALTGQSDEARAQAKFVLAHEPSNPNARRVLLHLE